MPPLIWKISIPVLIGLATLEMGCRFLPRFLKEPLRSTVLDIERTRLCNRRRYGPLSNAHAILLPPAERADVVFVGDSFVFGDRVRAEDTFVRLFARHRKVINLGVLNTNPVQYNRLIEVGLRYHPGLFVYAVFANDFDYVETPLMRPLSSENLFAHLPGDEALFKETLSVRDYVHSAFKSAADPFASVPLLRFFLGMGFAGTGTGYWKTVERSVNGQFYQFMEKGYWDSYLSWDNDRVKKSVAINTELVSEAFRLVQEQGAGFYVLLIPQKEAVYAPLISDPALIYDDSHSRSFREFSKELTRRGIPNLDLTSGLQEAARHRGRLYLPVDGHFSEEGHAVVAETLSRALAPALDTGGTHVWGG